MTAITIAIYINRAKVNMNKKRIILFCTIILAACATATPEPTQTPVPTPIPSATPITWDREGWNIVWHDEFEGAELDKSNWTFDYVANVGNGEWQTYTDRPENVRIENGMLVIEAREATGLTTPYSSARIKTEGLHTWQYGRFEARIKLPFGKGLWPAFWMLGDNFKDVGWPNSGEIDILEYGKTPDRIYSTIHVPGHSGGQGIGSSLVVPVDSLRDEFHTYAIEWEQDEIRWYFDDQQFFKLTSADVPDAWIFDQPFFIILNVAVGGTFPGYPDSKTVFPQSMLVDYVRVYQKP
jgi:beta-glucanase (GH16 family)